ncbi:uncharacterized protein LOC115875639 [Sitophilus oryzae]|uniref:Uncharacterized protein LOC115875639 n=1 Tax=Sitophilus oryzae TaxID=7048 RepID=A0A6J2X7P5_SITOR|nr:uncharacterized protein LOC115875639 [Sitophilus oryzae]
MEPLSKSCLTLLSLILTLMVLSAQSALVLPDYRHDVYGNTIDDENAQYSPSNCCVIPTCRNKDHCYHTLSCGHLCSSGRYPPAEYSRTPGYKLAKSYTQFECRFGDCKNYEITCRHCPDPTEPNFSLYLVRKDCKNCYSRQY